MGIFLHAAFIRDSCSPGLLYFHLQNVIPLKNIPVCLCVHMFLSTVCVCVCVCVQKENVYVYG